MKIFGVLSELSVLVYVEQGNNEECCCKPCRRNQGRGQERLPDRRIQRVSESEYPEKPLIGCIDPDGRDLKERGAQSRLVLKVRGDVLRGDDVGCDEEKQAEQG
jgi:hypothetical protein